MNIDDIVQNLMLSVASGDLELLVSDDKEGIIIGTPEFLERITDPEADLTTFTHYTNKEVDEDEPAGELH